MTEHEQPRGRDEEFWAKPVSELHVGHELPPEAIDINVEGKRVAGLSGGFGKMWQKTYQIRLEGAQVSPEQVVKTWKENFGNFWPRKASFYGSMAGISPGDVVPLTVKTGGMKLATGILVLYADDVSFSFMTPEGHMFVGMITFSAHTADGVTIAQTQGLIRAQDPLYEVGMLFGGHRGEDRQWTHVLQSLAKHFGVEAKATTTRVLVDRKRQWSQWRNIRKNAAIRSGSYMLKAPFRAIAKPFRRARTR
jgi:hypothetical protein